MGRLIVVSNRVNVPRGNRPAPGGLAVGLQSALEANGGAWVGWDGRVEKTVADDDYARYRSGDVEYLVTPMSRRDYNYFYAGYANRVLWPLCHERLNLIEYQRDYFQAYRDVNLRFAERVAREVRGDDLIWVHDYHLIPLAHELRKLGIGNRIGYFHHIPFPAYDLFRVLPNHFDLLRFFCAYDLVGFQTALDVASFSDSMRYVVGHAELDEHSFRMYDRVVRVGHYPIGIDYPQIRESLAKVRETSQVRRLRDNLAGRKLMVGVDRLDYSKGLAERFRAFEKYLSRTSSDEPGVVLMQIAQPSRSDVPEYQQIKDEIDFLAGKINARFSVYDRVPLRYMNRSFSRPNVIGFLSYAWIGLITPLRDGMNLVAKEFVAAQNEGDPGVLILSRLAGAADELADGALLVTPYDVDGVADAIATGLSMPLAERRERWHAMLDKVKANTITGWAQRYLEALKA